MGLKILFIYSLPNPKEKKSVLYKILILIKQHTHKHTHIHQKQTNKHYKPVSKSLGKLDTRKLKRSQNHIIIQIVC